MIDPIKILDRDNGSVLKRNALIQDFNLLILQSYKEYLHETKSIVFLSVNNIVKNKI